MSDFWFLVLLVLGGFLALGTSGLLSGLARTELPMSRFAPLDGLRGLAAYGVFFDHCAYWRSVSLGGSWTALTPLTWSVGSTAVSLFFMMTAFLFTTKVVFGNSRTDWLRLYVSRVTRMTPLFLFALMLMLSMIAVSDGTLRESPELLAKHVAQWASLTTFGNPDINRFSDTSLLTAHVTWTLPYEWFFYLTLPIVALCSSRRASPVWSLPATLAATLLLLYTLLPGTQPKDLVLRLAPFAFGALAAIAAQSAAFQRLAGSRGASVVVLMMIVASIGLGAYRSKFWMVLCPAVAFGLIAAGNTAFGSLVSSRARALGQISYSVYLLHGLLLYGVFKLLIGSAVTARLSDVQYWLLILSLVPVLVAICQFTFFTIESPGMARTAPWVSWIQARRSPFRI